MRALLIGALAATLVGCSCPLRPQVAMELCPEANGFACFDSTDRSLSIEPKPASFKTNSVSLKSRLLHASNAAADSETTRANVADSSPGEGAVANSNTATIQEQVVAATTVAERMTVGAVVAHKDRPNHLETALRGDAEKVAPASPPADTVWVVSETTSPVDYSPLVTAVIHSTSSVKDAPNTLAVRCRGSRTELLLRTEGTWRASHASEVQVDYQINDQPFVRLQWTASADGKAATYKDDAIGLLRSLPEGARLKISVLDRPGPGHEATFQLAGLDAVRKKIAVACKWAPIADKMSSGKR
jgi:hypothetical protein